MTEDEAKTKWCPFARVASVITKISAEPIPVCGNRVSIDPAVASTSGSPTNPPSARCIASACMSWRWMQAKDTEAFNALVRSKLADGDNYQKVLIAALKEHREAYERTEGFCGMAGPPS